MEQGLSLSLTIIIVAVTSIVSITAFSKRELFERWLYNPFMVVHQKQYLRIFSHALLHGSWTHLIFNMYIFFMFNRDGFGMLGVESSFKVLFGNWSSLAFLGLYIGGIAFATIPGLIKHRNNPSYRSIGASGAVSAIVFTFMLLNPTRGMGILFIPISIPAFIFAPLYILLESYMSRRGNTGIAHDAHIWGALYGFLFPTILKPQILINFLHEAGTHIQSWFN